MQPDNGSQTRPHSARSPDPAAAKAGSTPLLEVNDLSVSFPDGTRAVDGTSFAVYPGEVVGIAGQSGSGKTMTGLAVMGLLPDTATVHGSVRFDGRELLELDEKQWRAVRGDDVTMVFQETVTALNPLVRVGKQLLMTVRAHRQVSKGEALARIHSSLKSVGLSDTDRVMRSYPHELSGGMCQRIMIAMAVSCSPRLLIADEPTTALDVSVQREVLDVMKDVIQGTDVAMIIVSHDIGVLEETCDRIVVMYRGEVVEVGPSTQVVTDPLHPYTQGLLASLPTLRMSLDQLKGMPGDTESLPASDLECRYRSRCPEAFSDCVQAPPLLQPTEARRVRCWLHRTDGEREADTDTNPITTQ